MIQTVKHAKIRLTRFSAKRVYSITTDNRPQSQARWAVRKAGAVRL